MNEGAAALAAKKLSLSAISGRLKARGWTVSKQGVANWLKAEKLPALDARPVLEAEFGIDPGAWEREAGRKGEKKVADDAKALADTPATADDSAQEQARSLLARIGRWRKQAEGDGATLRERRELTELEMRAIKELAALTGERATPESTLLRSPAWTSLAKELIDVLEGHPDALRAVVAVLRRRAAA